MAAPRWVYIAAVALATALAEEAGYKKAKKERILGVGLGVFLLAFFFLSMCGLCWVGTLLPQERNEQWCASPPPPRFSPRKKGGAHS